MLGDDPEFLKEFFGTFLGDISSKLPKLQESMTYFDGNKVYQVAHSFAGSANCLGARELQRVTIELEEAARTGGRADTQQAFERFSAELTRVQQFLQQYLERTN